jgi:DNA-binding winged helix-turn-helix (wHTH) protein/Tol biopolymer transport system component
VSTEPSISRDRVFRFGPFELSERQAELRKSGVRIKLQEQPFRVLVELVANSGNLVSRDDLHRKLWPADTFVDFDVGLNSAIRKLRQALGDDAENPRYIETLAKRGYRFLAAVAATVPGPPVAELAAVSVETATLRSVEPHSVVEELTSAEPPLNEPPFLRKKVRLWQVAVAGVALLALGVGLAWWLRPAASRQLVPQRITANPPDVPVTGAVISPDGKYVAYSDPTGVYIRHIDSGETRPLALPKGFEGVPSSWYPDSTHLLLTGGDGPQQKSKVWKVSILGGDPQMLLEDAEHGVVSPDGSQIVFLHVGSSDYDRELWLAEADGHNARRLVERRMGRSGKETDLWSASWSPNGQRIAYIERESVPSNSPTGDRFLVYSRKVDGSDERFLFQDGRMDSVPGQYVQLLPPPLFWAPDGRLYFALQSQKRKGGHDDAIWSIGVDQNTGEPQGEPREMLRGLGWIGGFSASKVGKRLVFWRSDVSNQVFVSDFDGNSRKMSSPRRLTIDRSANFWAADWTADSKAVVFASTQNGTHTIYKQELNATTPDLLNKWRKVEVILPRLSGDGSEILYADTDKPDDPKQPVDLMAVPIAGGMPRVILSEPGINNFICAKPPSQMCMLQELLASGNFFYLFDFRQGKVRLVANLPGDVNSGFSPDGSTLALDDGSTVRFVSIDSGVVKDVVLKDWPIRKSADFSADGKVLLIASVTPTGAPVILGIDLDGNVKVLLEGDRSAPLGYVVPSPDGKHGALDITTGESNVWMVENY